MTLTAAIPTEVVLQKQNDATGEWIGFRSQRAATEADVAAARAYLRDQQSGWERTKFRDAKFRIIER